MRFSVIIPLYNKAPYIEKALRSVLAQTFADYELIVVDDGSTDASAGAVQRTLEGSDIRWRLISKENGGVSSARNAGIDAADGEYACLLDADDWWEPAFLERMDILISNYPDAGLYCSNYYYVHNGKNTVKLDIPTGYFDYCKEYARTLCMVATSSCCSATQVLKEMGGFKTFLKLGEDFDLWIRIALKYGTAIIDEPLVYFNNDLPVAHRATHHLVPPAHHMLWHLDYLSEEERTNPDYKQLIDNLRTYSLLPYYLSSEYRDAAKQELAKVDWSRQPEKCRKLYRKPVWYLKCRRSFRRCGASVKRWIIRHK